MHVLGLSGCDVKDKSQGEAMPSARLAPDGYRNCGRGGRDGGHYRGDGYEAK